MKIDNLLQEKDMLEEKILNILQERQKNQCSEPNEELHKYIKRSIELSDLISFNENAIKIKNKSKKRLFVRQNKNKILAMFKNECYICKFSFKDILHVHHIIPLSKGGLNDIDNLVVLCPNCHSLIHKIKSINSNETKEQYEQWIYENMTINQNKKLEAIK